VLRELLAAGERGPKTIFCLVRASATETALRRREGHAGTVKSVSFTPTAVNRRSSA